MPKILETKFKYSKLNLPLPKEKNISCLIAKQCYFTFNDNFYRQLFMLTKNSSLSGTLPYLVLEILKSGPFHCILPEDVTYFRYTGDAILIYPKTKALQEIVDR